VGNNLKHPYFGGIMNIMDLHHKVFAEVALKSQAIASSTTTVGETIDLSGFEGGAEFTALTKILTDGDYEFKLFEGDLLNMSDEAEVTVASGHKLGSVNFADDTDDDAVGRFGYIGKKRYVRVKVVSTNVTTGVDNISCTALKYTAKHQPTSDQNG
jgi:hypothetical protein